MMLKMKTQLASALVGWKHDFIWLKGPAGIHTQLSSVWSGNASQHNSLTDEERGAHDGEQAAQGVGHSELSGSEGEKQADERQHRAHDEACEKACQSQIA